MCRAAITYPQTWQRTACPGQPLRSVKVRGVQSLGSQARADIWMLHGYIEGGKKKHSLGIFNSQFPPTYKGIVCHTRWDQRSIQSGTVPPAVVCAWCMWSPPSRQHLANGVVGTERTDFSQGPAALILCPIDAHKDKCSGQIFGWYRSPSRLESQESPLGYF